eukprot:6161499-Prymnesium_polylepis.1
MNRSRRHAAHKSSNFYLEHRSCPIAKAVVSSGTMALSMLGAATTAFSAPAMMPQQQVPSHTRPQLLGVGHRRFCGEHSGVFLFWPLWDAAGCNAERFAGHRGSGLAGATGVARGSCV